MKTQVLELILENAYPRRRQVASLQYVAETQILDIRSVILLGRKSGFSLRDSLGPQSIPSGILPRTELTVNNLCCDENTVHGDDRVHGGGIQGCFGGLKELGSDDGAKRIPSSNLMCQ